MANELIVAQNIPSTLIVQTEHLVQEFHQKILPLHVSDFDMAEIMNQIADMVEKKDKATTFSDFRALPNFDRIASKQFLDTIERQHLIRSAVFDLACGVYRELERLGVFDSYRFKNRFPYAFERMIGMDATFFHIPY